MPARNSMRGSEPVFGRALVDWLAAGFPGNGTGGVDDTPAPSSGIVESCADATAGHDSIAVASSATRTRRGDHGTSRTLMALTA